MSWSLAPTLDEMDNSGHVVDIPMAQLSPEALLGVIDAYILREGTDYGHQEISLDEKRAQVRTMLAKGEARICFYPEIEHIDIVLST